MTDPSLAKWARPHRSLGRAAASQYVGGDGAPHTTSIELGQRGGHTAASVKHGGVAVSAFAAEPMRQAPGTIRFGPLARAVATFSCGCVRQG